MDLRQAERRAASVQRLAALAALGLAAAALVVELRKSPGERRWHGRLGGLVPYDFRPPSLARFRRSWWSPDDPRLLTETAFGVGWDINLGRLVRRARRYA
jgi:hypothetical protein